MASRSKALGIQKKPLGKRFRESIPFYLMLLPGFIFVFIFNYFPLYGLKIAFYRFIPAKGLFGDQEWVGMRYFQEIFVNPDFQHALVNTITISLWKLSLSVIIAIFFSILINELRSTKLKRTVQTIVYLPHFLSWVILAGVFLDLLSPEYGMVNQLIKALGGESIFFLGSNQYFQGTLIVTDLWKEFGFNTIVYLAAITSIDPSLYESAVVDGANRFKQIWHITLPGMLPIILLMALLNIGSVMNANFDQVYNMYSPAVYATGDVLDTLIYRIGLVQANFSLSTAVGMFKSLVSLILVGTSYGLAYKFAGYKIF